MSGVQDVEAITSKDDQYLPIAIIVPCSLTKSHHGPPGPFCHRPFSHGSGWVHGDEDREAVLWTPTKQAPLSGLTLSRAR